MNPQISLSQLKICFQGIVPSVICSHDHNLIPNISYLSHVEYVDDSHVALSNQFFSKTKQNVLANGKALILVYHPGSLQTFELRAKFVGSEFTGELFERMALRISILAGQDGMSQVYRLLSADIYKIEEIRSHPNFVHRPVSLPPPQAPDPVTQYQVIARGFLEILNNQPLSYEQKMDLFLRTLKFGMGLKHVHVYLKDSSQSLRRFRDSMINEIELQDIMSDHTHIAQKAAKLGKLMTLGGLQLQRRYYQSNNLSPDRKLFDSNIQRQLAIPFLRQGETWAALIVEDEKSETWDQSLIEALKITCAGLSMAIRSDQTPALQTQGEMTGFKFVWDSKNEVLFLNQSPLLRNLPGLIFSYVIKESKSRTHPLFSNQEVISALKSHFPEEGKVNFEARLSLIRKRLADRGLPFKLLPYQRGHFQLVMEEGFHFSVESV